MKLKELKQLVAEEYNKYMSEQDPMGGLGDLPTAAGAPADPTVAVSDKDINLDGGDEDAEATLRDIFNMLKDFFEGDDDDKPAAPKAPKAPRPNAPVNNLFCFANSATFAREDFSGASRPGPMGGFPGTI